MSVDLAGAERASAQEKGGIAIAEKPFVDYLWSDLKARRNGLSFWPEGLVPVLGVDLARYLTYEYARPQDMPRRFASEWTAMETITAQENAAGMDDVPPEIVSELVEMEAFVAGETQQIIDEAPAEGPVRLSAVVDQETFTADYPYARTFLFDNLYPVTLQYVALGRAAAELRRRGRDVEVYRGERYFDLTSARLAVGLGKKEVPLLLGLNEKSYNVDERGARPGGTATMKDLQALDDFIDETAGHMKVSDDHGVKVIWVHDDQDKFTKTYPKARFERSGKAYPVRALWVAAARRAGALEAAGQQARIAVDG